MTLAFSPAIHRQEDGFRLVVAPCLEGASNRYVDDPCGVLNYTQTSHAQPPPLPARKPKFSMDAPASRVTPYIPPRFSSYHDVDVTSSTHLSSNSMGSLPSTLTDSRQSTLPRISTTAQSPTEYEASKFLKSSFYAGASSTQKSTFPPANCTCIKYTQRPPPSLTLNGAHFKHVTELDVSENGITSLEVSSLASLSSLTCGNNSIVTLSIHGAALTSLVADNNRLSSIRVKNHPRRLTNLNISRNCIGSLPPWVVSCGKMTYLDVSHNQLTSLPGYVTSGHLAQLRILIAHHNSLKDIPSPRKLIGNRQGGNLGASQIEILHLHCNKIEELPETFFKDFVRLRILNVSSNRLKNLPPTGNSDEVSSTPPPLQELYAANNLLRCLMTLEACQSLRILYVPFNKLTVIQGSVVSSWELLEEMILSGNFLTSLPVEISKLPRLRSLRVHLNPIKALPRLSHLSALKVVDASHCLLGRFEFESIVGPSLTTLDIAANPSLSVDKHQFSKCKSRRSVNVVNTAEKGRSLPFQQNHLLATPSKVDNINVPMDEVPFRRGNHQKPEIPWTLGFSELSGYESKLSIGQLRVPEISGEKGRVAILAMADGGQGADAIQPFLSRLPPRIQDERKCSPDLSDALKYSLLSVMRDGVLEYGHQPESACIAYLESEKTEGGQRNSSRSIKFSGEDRRSLTLRICSFGDMSVVVTTSDGPPLTVSTSGQKRAKDSYGQHSPGSACKASGRCSLVSSTLPDPYTTVIRLGPHHRSVIMASSSLWNVVDPSEVNEISRTVQDPSVVAKRLTTLAQSYGQRKPLSVIVCILKFFPLNTSSHYSSMKEKKVRYHPDEVQNSSPLYSLPSISTALEDTQRIMTHSSPLSAPSLPDLTNSIVRNKTRTQGGSVLLHSTDEALNSSLSSSTSLISNNYGQPKKSRISQSKSTPNITYYLYPRPDDDITSRSEISHHLLTFGNETMNGHHPVTANIPHSVHHPLDSNDCVAPIPPELISPPVGFGDSDDETSDSDSGFSGNSEGYPNGGVNVYNSGHIMDPYTQYSVNDEQLRSHEYLLARNAKVLYLRELDNIDDAGPSSLSTPNLAVASAAPLSGPLRKDPYVPHPVQHFQRNTLRKSRFPRGTIRLIQNKFNPMPTHFRFASLPKLRMDYTSPFKRFGSLQNLKYYQSQRPYLFKNGFECKRQSCTDLHLVSEMQERPSVDKLELESRMQQYWDTGVTCF